MKKSIHILIIILSPLFLMGQAFDVVGPADTTAHKDTVTVKVLCMNDRAVNGTFQDSEKIVGAQVYLAVKKMERAFEMTHVWEFQTKDGFSGYSILVEKNIQTGHRYLDSVENCYQLIPLQSEGQ